MSDKNLSVISIDDVRSIIKSEIQSGEYIDIVQSFQNKEYPVAISVVGRRMIRMGLFSLTVSSTILHLSRLIVHWSYYYCEPDSGGLNDTYKVSLLEQLINTHINFVYDKVLSVKSNITDDKIYFSLVDSIMARFIYDGFSYYRFKTCMMRRMRMSHGISSSQFNHNLYMLDVCRKQYGRWLEYKIGNPEANVNNLLDRITTDISTGTLELLMFNVQSINYILKEPNGDNDDILSVLNDDCSDAMVGYGYTSKAWDIIHSDDEYSMCSKFIYHNLASEVFKSRMYYQLSNDIYKLKSWYGKSNTGMAVYDHNMLKYDLCTIIKAAAKQSKTYKDACNLINDIGFGNKTLTDITTSIVSSIDPNDNSVRNDISKVKYIGRLAKSSEMSDNPLRALSSMILMYMLYGLNA